jgi:Zinc knuckle
MQTATSAEDYLDSVKERRTHNIRLETNAVPNPLPEMDKRGSIFPCSRSPSRERSQKPGSCHLCGQPGHWRIDCPKNKGGGANAYTRTSRPRDRERSSSRTRYSTSFAKQGSSSRSSMYDYVGNLARKVDQLSEQLGRFQFRSRSHSFSRSQSREGRSGRRHDHRSRSFSRSRSHSRYRSGSRPREGQEGYISRSNSRSNSRTRDRSRCPRRDSRDCSKNGRN